MGTEVRENFLLRPSKVPNAPFTDYTANRTHRPPITELRRKVRTKLNSPYAVPYAYRKGFLKSPPPFKF